MEKGIIKTLRYFSQFEYAPTLFELRLFHPEPVSETVLKKTVDKLIKKRELLWITTQECQVRYTLGGYSILLNKTEGRVPKSRNKVKRIQPYLHMLQRFGVFSLVGLSGSVAMENAGREADVDLFIITSRGRMWTGRAVAAAAATVMGVRRGRTTSNSRNKICLNMFMDEADLTVPKSKQNEFVAHEILQMKPVFARGAIYDRFLNENSWIYKFFPNAQTSLRASAKQSSKIASSPSAPRNDKLRPRSLHVILNLVQDLIESTVRYLQLQSINRHKTTEIVTDTQLWFFPNDFEKKVTV